MLKTTITEVVIHDIADTAIIKDTTTVNLVDEGGGKFITITQYDNNFKEVVIRLDITEIPLVFNAISIMLKQ